MGGKWPYSRCFIGCCFRTRLKQHGVKFLSSFFSNCFITVPTCHAYFIWMVCEMGGKWPYSCYAVKFLSSFFFNCFITVPTCHAYLIWMICEMGGKWPYSSCFMSCLSYLKGLRNGITYWPLTGQLVQISKTGYADVCSSKQETVEMQHKLRWWGARRKYVGIIKYIMTGFFDPRVRQEEQ